jgi:thymidylate kinase
VLRNRTSGERDANQPQVRDQTEPSIPKVTKSLNSGEAEQFSVLLGPDYAGKSSVMTELRATVPDWQLVSVDGAFLGAERAVLSRLKHALVDDTLPGLGTAFSTDFAVSLLQTAVVYLRDRITAVAGTAPVLVDSYYYKILAKCRLVCADHHPVFAWWRSFPQPRQVLYLDVAPGVAWSRCGARANRLEHYGARPDRESFETFQTDLRKLMLDEVRDLPVVHLPERDEVAESARDVRKVLLG